MKQHTYAVIMAGGKGERFWPESRETRPKQLLKLFSDQSMLEMTVARIAPLVDYEHIFIITNLDYAGRMRELLPEIPAGNIIGEPARRDTAPCVALAAGLIYAKDPQASMLLLPADHMIVNHSSFRKDIELAVNNAADDLFTLGIPPTFPCTDYGYIESEGSEKINRVIKFVEKPGLQRAKEMLESGNYLWNSGMFIWKNSTIIEAFRKYAPEFSDFIARTSEKCSTSDFDEFLNREFPLLPKISIDYAIMEKCSNIKVIKAEFDWDDAGNWGALRKYLKQDENGNVSNGNVQLLDSGNNIVFSNSKDLLIAGIDLNDMLIVHSDNAILIAPESSAHKLKTLLKEISEKEELKKFL